MNTHINSISNIDDEDVNRRFEYISYENDKTSEVDTDLKKQVVTYRFKFTEQFMKELHIFSKIHQYDERKDFKEAWAIWSEENAELIQDEQKRIILLGYNGNILEKMYKSSRYYFRNRTVDQQRDPVKRRKYISVEKDLLDAMDEHIHKNMFCLDYKPQTGFVLFCNEHKDILRKSIAKICEEGTKDPHIIQEKIKKTYKNRYFVIVKK